MTVGCGHQGPAWIFMGTLTATNVALCESLLHSYSASTMPTPSAHAGFCVKEYKAYEMTWRWQRSLADMAEHLF